ncbi:glucosyltransferase domain-containing protein [Paenibacillus maysiensis]|uniref:glucosyltransferase domain-containing protein n=1 Tax=Paenibacillus maysiensis TaxID=1155954 RepID=UPI00047081BA|nr:glucosyltransferase domain-containing protein [Paenibacillus maysiensis]
MLELTRAFSELKNEYNSLIFYLKNNKLMCLVLIFFSLLAYGFPLTHYTLSIDEEKAMFRGDRNISIWSDQGRYGISLIKLLLHYQQGNSVTNTYLAVVLLIVTAILWSYMFSELKIKESYKKQNLTGVIVSLLFVTFPSYAENIGFSMMSIELGIGWIMISIATLLTTRWVIFHANNYYVIISIFLVVFATSIYQSFIPVIICGVLLITLIHLNSLYIQKINISLLQSIKMLIKYGIILLISLVIYKIIDKIVGAFIPPSAYISNFFLWGKQDSGVILRELIHHFEQLIFGKVIYGSAIILPSMLIIFLIIVIYFIRVIMNKALRNTGLSMLLFSLIFVTCPFLMSLLLGYPLQIRVNIVLPLFIASVWLLLYVTISNRIFGKFIIICVIYLSFYQSISVSQLFFGDYNRYQEDVKLANQIGGRIQDLNLGDFPLEPVVYVGSHKHPTRKDIIKQEVLGYSFFEWDDGNQVRISNFMRSLGYDYKFPTDQEIETALKESIKMPTWPDRESIALMKGLIIVNLSEDMDNYKITVFQDEKEITFNSTIYRMDFQKTKLESSPTLTYKFINSSLSLNSQEIDPLISLSLDHAYNGDTFKYILIKLESNVEGDMQVYLRTKDGEYSEKLSTFMHLNKGDNSVYLKLPNVMNSLNSLRLDPPNNSVINLKTIELVN